MRVLLVEDDRKAARLVSKGLHEAGFLVDIAYSAEEGDEMSATTDYAAIVLDWLLPGRDGIAFCHDLRARGVSTPILMLTARQGLDDRVTGLNVGADDYLTKPFAFAELLARLHALLRRSAITRPIVLTIGDLSLDPVSHVVTRAGTPINLTPKEYAILEVLMRQPGEVLTRASLGERLWRDDDDVNNLVDVHVSHLRKKIDRPPLEPLIHTVWGRGYRLGPAP
ncbi:MAG: DNA-binding response regulator [Candidatus Rokuibacteriota bacterium]|nr:MAG: DNA-binding response regulator [Candidatus Rokubacteria bacterium]